MLPLLNMKCFKFILGVLPDGGIVDYQGIIKSIYCASLYEHGLMSNTLFDIGGLKLWECTIDLVEMLRREIQDGQLSFRGKRVLEVIFRYLNGTSEVLVQCLLQSDECKESQAGVQRRNFVVLFVCASNLSEPPLLGARLFLLNRCAYIFLLHFACQY